MKTQEFSSLGVKVPINVPETVDEFDVLGKAPGTCLREAINNVVYRGCLAEFRDSFCESVEAETKIERKTEGTGKFKEENGQKTEILAYAESEGKYMARVLAERKLEDATSFQSLANSVAAAIVFDPSATERKPSLPKKLSADILAKANEVVTNGRFDKVVAKIQKDLADTVPVPTSVGDPAKDAEALGWYMKAHQSHLAKQRLAGY